MLKTCLCSVSRLLIWLLNCTLTFASAKDLVLAIYKILQQGVSHPSLVVFLLPELSILVVTEELKMSVKLK